MYLGQSSGYVVIVVPGTISVETHKIPADHVIVTLTPFKTNCAEGSV
jgi:hypothetical protein